MGLFSSNSFLSKKDIIVRRKRVGIGCVDCVGYIGRVDCVGYIGRVDCVGYIGRIDGIG